jgi:hypothetical protein
VTPVEAAYLRRLTARLRLLEPGLYEKEIQAYKLIREAVSEAEIVRMIQSGALDQMIAELLADEVVDPALRPLRLLLHQTLTKSASLGVRDMPSWLQAPFGVISPQVLEAAETLDTRVIQNLIKPELRETFRQHVINGLTEGVGPREIARGARASLGLAPNQERAVRNFERMLREGDAEALTRKLRDRRFDRTILRGNLTEAQIETQVNAYRRRMIAHNAETHARTATLSAQKHGQRLSWEDAISRGVVDRSQLRRIWTTVGDDRVRDEHVAMNGEVATWDGLYSNGDRIPGDGDYNCRCFEKVAVAQAQMAA